MSEQHDQLASAEARASTPNLGEVFRQTREGRGESIADVAHALKLSPRQIEAIEMERFDLLPGAAFVRGFVRNYARYLGLDPDAMLTNLSGGVRQDVRLAPVTNANGSMPSAVNERKIVRPVMAVVAGMVAVLLLGWYFDWFALNEHERVAPVARSDHAAPVPPASAPVVLPAPPLGSPAPPAMSRPESSTSDGNSLRQGSSDTPDQAEAVAEESADGDPARTAGEVDPVADVETGQFAGEAAESDSPSVEEVAVAGDGAPGEGQEVAPGAVSAPDVAPGTVGPAPVMTASPDEVLQPEPLPEGMSRLVFALHGESWIQVRDAEGMALYTGTGQAGSSRTVQGHPPFAIVVGNAGMVTLTRDGQTVDLEPHTSRGGVARLSVP